MRKILFIPIFVMSIGMQAQHQFQLEHLTGMQVLESLGTLGTMEVQDTSLLVYSPSHELLLTYAMTNNSRITFDYVGNKVTIGNQSMDIPEGVNEAKANKVNISREGQQLLISGAPVGGTLYLFSVSGQAISQKKIAGDPQYLSISGLGAGSYLLVVANQVFKFAKEN